MSRLATVLVACCGIVVSAQVPVRDRPRSTPPPTGSARLYGRIVASATGDPLRHARVSVSAGNGTIAPTLSDEQGRFSFATLAVGRYTLTAVKPGFARTSIAIPVTTGAANAGDLPLDRGGVIAGLLLDDMGDPLPDADVTLERVLTADGKRSRFANARTDDLGAFRFAGLPAGSFLVSPPRRFPFVNTPFARTPTPNFGRAPEPVAVTIQTGEERQGIVLAAPTDPFVAEAARVKDLIATLKLDPKQFAVLRGRVTTPSGAPVAKARVVALSTTVAGGAPTTTDESGAFEILLPLAKPTDFRLSARKPGYVGVEYGQRRRFERGQIVHPVAGETLAQLDMNLTPLVTLSGRVVDDVGEPVEGAVVRALSVRHVNGRRMLVDGAATTPRTDDLGRYRIYGLQPGRPYAIAASVGEVVVAQPADEWPGFVTTYFPGTTSPAEIRFVAPADGQELSALDFRLERGVGFRVAGQASDATGEPITGGIAMLPRSKSNAVTTLQMGARIAPDGSFEFLNVAPGDYVLQIARGRGREPYSEGEFAYQFVTVTDGDVTGIDIQAGLGSTINGRIVIDGEASLNPSELTLSAVPADPDRTPRVGGPIARARIDDDLRFELTRISGPRRIEILRAPKGWMMKAVRVGGVEVTDRPIAFGTDEQSLEDVEVELTNQVTRISGSLTTGRDLAPADVTVVVYASDPNLWYPGSRFLKRVTGAADATYLFEGLPPADYFVVAIQTSDDPGEWQDPDLLERLTVSAKRVRLSDGEKVTADLRPAVR